MSKVLGMFVVVSTLGTVFFTACGDDEEEKKSAAVDCDAHGADATKCDYAVCSVQGATGDACYDAFLDCYMTGCPSGSDVANADMNVLTTCSQDYMTCLLGGDGTDNGGSDNGGGDPFEGVDCTITDTASCDNYICQMKQIFDAVDCSTSATVCDCYGDYVDCALGVCPAGTAIGTDTATGLTDCATTLNSCTGATAK